MAEAKTTKKESSKSHKKLLVVRLRGSIKVKQEIVDTLNMMKLYNKNNCVIVDSTPSMIGMLRKAAGYITWGEADEATIKLLKEKRGDVVPFRLQPPRKGFGRKGIKIPFRYGGGMGYRGDKINDLVQRMI